MPFWPVYGVSIGPVFIVRAGSLICQPPHGRAGMRRGRNFLRVIIVSLFALISETAAKAQEWKVFEDRTLGFRVELPGTPIVSQEPVSTGTNLSISVGDLSIEITHILSKDGLEFDAFISEYHKEMVDLFNLPELERRAFDWNGYPAADLILGAPGHYVLLRVISTPTFVMFLIASDRIPLTGSSVVTRVLNSLSLF
jgi:hypothetical protein